MLGAIAGDIIGSVFERHPIKSVHFPLFSSSSRFTDDTVLTVAVASAIMDGSEYAAALKSFGRRYPDAGYGGRFLGWLFAEDSAPYNSWGNGSAMRVGPVGFAFKSLSVVLEEARKSAAVTHNHSEGVKGAQATALAVYLAFNGYDKNGIAEQIENLFGYDLQQSIDEIRPGYSFDVSCQDSVPQAIRAFLESSDVENAIRIAVSLGGDSDTQACIAGGIAHAYYKQVPEHICKEVRLRLPEEFLYIVDKFAETFMTKRMD